MQPYTTMLPSFSTPLPALKMASSPFSVILLHKFHSSTATFQLLRPYYSASYTVSVTNRRSLYSIISPLGDPSLSVVPVLDSWLQEGNTVKDNELQDIVKSLRIRKCFAHALQVSEWMSSKGLCPISTGDLVVQLKLIGRVRGLESVESYFQNLSDNDKTEKLHGALLNCYVMAGSVDKSLPQMQKMKDMGFVSPISCLGG